MEEIILGNWRTDIENMENISNEDLAMSHKMANTLLKMADDEISENFQRRVIKKLDKELKNRNISIIEGRYFMK